MRKICRGALLVLVIASTVGAQSPSLPLQTSENKNASAITMPGSPFGIAWGMLYGFPFVKPVDFMPHVRKLGAGFTKVNLFWSQVEPEPGKQNWTALDSYVAQLAAPDEGMLALFSSSQWATRTSTWAFPPSPAKNLDDYYHFIHDVVARTAGRVRYFQSDSEPNNPMFWAGTKEEYVAQIKVFYRAVKSANPNAVVVLGGCDGLFDTAVGHSIPGQEKGLEFFDFVLREAGHDFDVFDLHLYADPYTIPSRVEYIRKRMQAFGYLKPIICSEYDGPGFFEFPANRKYFGLLQNWSQTVASGNAADHSESKTNGIGALYERVDKLGPETQMFLLGCPDNLERKLERIQARDLIIRNVLAFASGVQKTAFWDLWHDTSKRDELPTLLYGKLKLIEFADGKLTHTYAAAEVMSRMIAALAGMETVRRINVSQSPTVYFFEVTRRSRGPLFIVWEKRDVFSGEALPAIPFEWEWHSKHAKAIDALGQAVPVSVASGRIKLQLAANPVFIDSGE